MAIARPPCRAVIYEADGARVWVVHSDKTIVICSIKIGITIGDFVQVLQGLQPGETVITKGEAFVDRAAAGS